MVRLDARFEGFWGCSSGVMLGRGRLRRSWRTCSYAACARAQAAAGGELEAQFAQLAAVLAPGTTLKADLTPLGRGLVATQPTAAGSTLLAVEWANVMAITDDPKKPAGNTFGKRVLDDWQLVHHSMSPLLVAYLLSEEDWFLRLVAWMLFLTSKVDQGPLTLYRQLLPKPEEMCCLMNFLPEERTHLQSTSLEAMARKEREDILGLHTRVFGPEGELRALRLAAAPEDTLFAACMVNSRCFSETVEGEVVSMVVPCADMANHQNNPNAVYAYSPARDSFEITAVRDIAAGEEVCISYGCQRKDNSELMRDYGFIIPANTNDRIPFSTGQDVASLLMSGGAPPASLSASRLRSALQSQAGASRLSPEAAARLPSILQSLRPFLRPDAPPAAGELSAGIRAAAGEPATAAGAAAVGGRAGRGVAVAEGPAQGAPLSEGQLAEERRSVESLQEQCAQMLAAHGTTAATDEALLRGGEGLEEGPGGSGPRVRQAVACRLERKRLIGAAREALALYGESLK